MVTDMALKFQEIFIKGLFFSVLLVKSSSRIMVEIDMKKNDAAPFPPRKLFVKNDEFNVKDRVICDPTSNADNLSLF